jgi:hypothetical protein
MNMPGFSAELSLAPAKGIYRSKAVIGRSSTVELAQTLLAPPDKECTKTFSAYVSHYFPVTVCEPSTYELPGDNVTQAYRSALTTTFTLPTGWFLRSAEAHRKGFPVLQTCRVYTIPFRAKVDTTVPCGGDPNHPLSVLEVFDHPELTISWNGGIEDIPAPYNPNWFDFVGESCSCCPGAICDVGEDDDGVGDDGIHPV